MRRLLILTQKEFLQMWRDPSAFILAFIMPAVMILLFGFCVNLDSSVTRLALVAEDESPAMHRLIEYLEGSRNIEVLRTTSRPEAQQLLHTGAVHGMLVVPAHAAQQAERHEAPDLLVATDGSIPNTAQFTAMYLQSIYARWQTENGIGYKVDIRTNYRFNPAAESRWYIVPGAIAMVLAMVGTFLTSMVVAREWERGTIESILATSTTRVEFLISKLIPYFFMGLGAMLVCVIFARFVFAVPIHASLWAVFGVAALFLLSVLCMGLLISTAVRNQYSASLISLMVAMLPSMLLSGFVFELTSAPGFVQGVSYFIPARYFYSCLTSQFLAGGHASVLLFNVGMLAVSALFWFTLVLLITPQTPRFMIHRIIALIIKELQEQFSTRRGVMVLIVPILMQTLLFPFVATQDVTHCEVVVLCDDTGAPATELMQRFAGAPYITEVKRAYSVKEMTDALDSQQCMVGVHIPSDFSRCLARGESAPLQVVCDGLRSNSSQIAAGYITSIASGLAEQNGSRLGGPTLRHLYNPTLNYRWFILACLFGMLGMITSMNISCMALAREREAGTYEQLCVTPLGAAELLIGKTVPATLILLGQCFIILLVATCGFGLPLHGSVAALYIALAIYSLSLTGIGFAISAFCKTQQQAFVGMFCFALPAVLLSGFIAPADNMPELLQWVSRCDPLYYIFIVTRGVFMKGYTLSDIIPQLTAFACIAAITMSTAYIVLKNKKG